jgi:hypothetical protein
MRPSDRAWIALGLGIFAWDALCDDGEMLSEASARYAKNHPVLAYAVIGSVAAHLAGNIPRWADPIHAVGVMLRHLKGRTSV